MRKLLIICSLFLSTNLYAAEFIGSEVRAWAGVDSVVGDMDAVQLGFTLEWNYIAADFSTGVKRVDWYVPTEPSWEANEWQGGSAVALRGYPFGLGYRVRPMVILYHSSDVARGHPFNDKDEPTSDFIGIGTTVFWKRVELDITVGRQFRECSITSCGKGAASNELMIRFRTIAFGARK